MDEKPLIYDFDLSELTQLLTSWGEPKYRAKQIWEGLYQHLWYSPADNNKNPLHNWSNIPKSLQGRLASYFCFNHLSPGSTLKSTDKQTQKTLFFVSEHNAKKETIEVVLMRYEPRQRTMPRYTLCISSQVGCAIGCKFCATGQMGFQSNLTAGEIIEQVIHFSRHLAKNDENLSNIVIMGMGEPFLNYDATLRAIQILNHADGMNIGERRFTISTVGIIPMIERFTMERHQINLAISLHAADDNLRSRLIPINRKYPLSDLLITCRAYTENTGRRITFEWALIKDINDTPEQAHKLVERIKNLLCHVNLIPLNPTSGYSGQGSNQSRAKEFQEILENNGIPCTLRLRRGIEIQAGCGQLVSHINEIQNNFVCVSSNLRVK
jgi:23S rRNA (adenine2503-C2)-methyltransferase